ncbi:hypothetical protein PTSG_03383 [Salpingoeca rosetta]|uniref:Proteasome subunit beta n=1 Tax=Salpingoeca rosetta (strain ATCC 50818 / BSB-021) TaxID=946362 RepID=F2U518_SALR5|nr:uncharacterized protein PTSG_03383 [Salpingoeca rosetta]EGD82734.1 hypothetical protein PTSG_03383 [Salpingoeca rosetta]|eukprot:XP_004995970.1 hypothetical protein PTSG_03383 [Salpingoeca rosetta]
MDFLIALVGKDFVLTAADSASARSIMRMKSDMDKMIPLSSHALMLLAGPVGDCSNFGDYIQANLKLQALTNGFEASTHATANYVRKNIADALRSRGAYQVNSLIAGVDEQDGPSLYYLDYLGTMVKVPYGAHGYGSFFTFATLDHHYREGMSLEEATDVLKKCFLEIKTRFLMNLDSFKVRVVDADGIREVEVAQP